MKPKYYIYVSDAKVDMLLPQVSNDIKKKVANEFKLNLKVLEVSRRSETESNENRFARLQSVVQHLRTELRVGSIDLPSEYFADELPMKWGPYVLMRDEYCVDPAMRNQSWTHSVLFGGSTDNTFCGLVGSTGHLVGSVTPKDAVQDYVAPSMMPQAVHFIEELARGMSISNPDNVLDVLAQLIGRLRGPAQRVEFIAKRLLEGTATYGPKTHCLLASPVYVALAE
jgi:hypothetical protein